MSRQYVLPLLAAAALVYACAGPRPQGSATPSGVAEAHAVRPTTAGMHAMASAASAAIHGPVRRSAASRGVTGDTVVGASLAVALDAGAPRFVLTVANVSDHRMELAFPDGHTRDFAVYDARGREVWRWSAGRMFTQVMRTKLLAAGDAVTYEERWVRPAPGRYSVVATLRSENHPLARTATFEIPEPGAAPAGDAAGGTSRVAEAPR
jgi:hypothetical protein